MDNNDLNNLDQNNVQPVVPQTPVEPQPVQAPIEQPPIQEPINEAQVSDVNNLEYNEVLKPGEELDDFHHEKQAEIIDVKFLGTNVMAILSLIFALFSPLIPIIMAFFALKQIKKTHEGGKILAKIAIVVNVIVMFIEAVILMYVMRVGPFENKLKNISDDQMRICSYKAYGCDSDEDENGFKTCSYCADDDTLCSDPKVIECPTDNLLRQSKKDEEKRRELNLDN